MKAIGGFFELELPVGKDFHSDAIKINTGRNCLEYIIKSNKYNCVYIPYYSCDSIKEPFIKHNKKYSYYKVNEKFEPQFKKKIEDDEAFLYINYFGICDEIVDKLADYYGKKLIVDNTMAFFANPLKKTDTFYSARKFFGVPDGAYLYTDSLLDEELEQDISHNRMDHLLLRKDLFETEEAYKMFLKNSKALGYQPIKKISNLTDSIMSSIDYNKVLKKRNDNFFYLHDYFKDLNELNININSMNGPMVYPLLIKTSFNLREKLINNKLFIATYWPNVLKNSDKKSIDYYFAKYLLPLPIDQRYGIHEMNEIIRRVSSWI